MILLHSWWLVPSFCLLVAYLLLRSRHADAWQRVISPSVLRFLKHEQHSSPRQIIWLIAAIACLALSGPSIQAHDKEAFRQSQGFIVLADVSRSMTLDDIAPSRLSAMRDAAVELASRAKASSVTLIAYAGDAFVITPPSFDIANYNHNVSLLNHGVIPVDGSNVTRALSLALSVIEDSTIINARLFLLSDSGGFNSRSVAAVARIADLGHQTDLLLFGSDTNNTDTTIETQIAKDMAKSGNGVLLQSDAIGSINYSRLGLDRISVDNKLLTQSGLTTLTWSNQSHWLLLLAIPLMLLMFYREFRQ